jgi:diacylglycerol kinase (ATP)
MSSTPGDLPKMAARAVEDGCELLIAAGGDGTLNGVLNGLVGRFDAIQLGLLPLGTGNDFARTVNIPRDLDHALAVLRERRAHRIDVIRATTVSAERYFINVSAGGFSSKVSEFADGDVKETWGPLCYARSFIGALPDLNDYHTTIRLDDGEVLTTPAYNLAVANARFVAGGVPIAPAAAVDDGLADMILLPVASLRELASLAPATLLGKHLDHDNIIYRQARKIEVSSSPPMRFNADGELLPAESITFEVLPSALQFIVGPQPTQADAPALESEPVLASAAPAHPAR